MAEESKALSLIAQFRQELGKMMPQFELVLPKHVEPAKFRRIVETAVIGDPDLLKAYRPSLLEAAMHCATDGLIPDGREAAFVVFRDADLGPCAQYMPMIAGICKKVRQSGELKTIDAAVVYKNDTYDSWVDEEGAHFKHVKARTDRGVPIFTYAYAITKDGGFFFEELTEEDIQKVKNFAKAKAGPWNGMFADEMRRKTALRRLAKYRLPQSTDLETMIRREDNLYDLDSPETTASLESQVMPKRISDEQSREKTPTVVDGAAKASGGATETGATAKGAAKTTTKEETLEAKLEALRAYVEDSSNEDFLAKSSADIQEMCRGLSKRGDELQRLLLAISARKDVLKGNIGDV